MRFKVYKNGVLIKEETYSHDSIMNNFRKPNPTRLEQLEKINVWNMNNHGWHYVLLRE